jgi:hypothetical protein
MSENRVNHGDLAEVHNGIEVRIEKTYGRGVRFQASLEEGHDIDADTYKEITDKIDAFLVKREKEDRPKLKPIPIYKIEKDDRSGTRILIKSALTGVHSGNGQPIVKVGNQPARTDGYGYGGYAKDLTIEDINKFNSIQARVVAADRDHFDWVGKHGIERLKDFAEEEFEKQKAGKP